VKRYFDPDYLAALDADAIERYHSRAGLKPEFRLQTQLGPHPYEGDVDSARMVSCSQTNRLVGTT